MLKTIKTYWVQITAVVTAMLWTVSGAFYAGHKIAQLESEIALLRVQVEVLRRTHKAVVRYVAATMLPNDEEARKFIQRFDAEMEEVLKTSSLPTSINHSRLMVPILILGQSMVKENWRYKEYSNARKELEQYLRSLRGAVRRDGARVTVEQAGAQISIPNMPPTISVTDSTTPTAITTGTLTAEGGFDGLP